MQMTIEKAQVTMPSDREKRSRGRSRRPGRSFPGVHGTRVNRRWMLGPPGWSMPVCEMDVRPGGQYSWRWRSATDGREFGFGGPSARCSRRPSWSTRKLRSG